MNKFKFTIFFLVVALLIPFTGCEDEDLNPVLVPETAVHGFAKISDGSSTSFFFGKNDSSVGVDLQWISIDQLNTVTKMDIFIEWRESYIDEEGNPRTANHGTKLVSSIEGSNVPANRTFTSLTITAAQLAELFKDATFDYGDGSGSISVFSDAFKTDRTPNSLFIADDSFTLTWAFTTDDGRYFDSWSDSVCSEFPGANCDVKWNVVCDSDLAGTYTAVVTNATSTDPCCPDATNITTEVTLTETGDGLYEISDYSFGLYFEWYDVYGVAENDPALKASVSDVCNTFILDNVADYFDASIKVRAQGTIDPQTNTISLQWENDWGDKATVVLTKK